MKKILIHNGNIYQPEKWLTPGFLSIQGGVISAVQPGEPDQEAFLQAEQVIDANGMAILPGLVNGHSHFSQSFMRGLAGGRPLLQWLKELIWPLQSAFSKEEMYLASLLGLAENVRGGVTYVVDHHKITHTPEHTLAVKKAAEEIGLRCTIARAWSDRGNNPESGDAILDELEGWYGMQQPDSKVTFASGPLTPWRASGELIQKTHAQALRYGSFSHIHVSETLAEVEMTVEETGVRPVTWLDQLGILDEHVHIVHAVWVDEAEIELLKERNALVVHCPVSNAVLGSGIAPVGKMLARGVRMRMGTDGSASNDTQDCIENAKMAICLARAGHQDAANLTNDQALSMLIADRTIAVGDDADLTMIKLDTLRSAPVHDLTSAVTLCAHAEDVDTVIVAGKILMQNGRLTTIDEEILIKECNSAIKILKKRAGIDI
ncbi:MAG: amidohydrolase [Anaerolineaceae bacterium]|jgi:5-methylthioadenosine/S-adenosylhomocysteine deaminase|nr:amidohydrolase [Anaerolineaceae bacterium]